MTSTVYTAGKDIHKQFKEIYGIPFAYILLLLSIILHFNQKLLNSITLLINYLPYQIINFSKIILEVSGKYFYILILLSASLLIILLTLYKLIESFITKHQQNNSDGPKRLYKLNDTISNGISNITNIILSLITIYWMYYIFLCQILSIQINTNSATQFINIACYGLNGFILILWIFQKIFNQDIRPVNKRIFILSESLYQYTKMNSIIKSINEEGHICKTEYAFFKTEYNKEPYFIIAKASGIENITESNRNYQIINTSTNFEVIKYMFEQYI